MMAETLWPISVGFLTLLLSWFIVVLMFHVEHASHQGFMMFHVKHKFSHHEVSQQLNLCADCTGARTEGLIGVLVVQ